MGEYRERATKGAEWLDTHYPGWIDKINLEILDLGHERKCIGSQVIHGSWSDFTRRHYGGVSRGISEMHGHPIWLYDTNGEYAELTQAWRDLINARQLLDSSAEQPAAEEAPPVPTVTMDGLLLKHADRLDQMHKDGSIGDNSFLGALYLFAREIKDSGVVL